MDSRTPGRTRIDAPKTTAELSTQMMSWAARFQLRQHLRQSLWAVPLAGTVAGAAFAALDLWLEDHVSLPAEWSYSQSTASGLLTAVAGAMIGLLGLVVTIGVLVVTMATSTLSPRFMRLWYRDRLQKVVLAAFTATFVFSLALLRQIGSGSVPDLGVTVAGVAVTVDLFLLLLYLDRFVHALRPVAVAAAMARAGLAIVASPVFGTELRGRGDTTDLAKDPAALHVRAAKSGAIQAVDLHGIVAFATSRDLVCVLRNAVGDFVNAGSTVMDVYGAPRARDERPLNGMVALGHERTIDQDPAFAVRIIVDIAIRALSPAVNDPTTATQMVNHLGALLEGVGKQDLSGRGLLVDGAGRPRLVVPTRSWANYLELGLTEIRQYGMTSSQVCRRLRAMLNDLEASVLPVNRPAVRQQLALLDESVRIGFPEADAQAFAMAEDPQGIGGVSMQGRP
jgi:uncharacterized membrane protein